MRCEYKVDSLISGRICTRQATMLVEVFHEVFKVRRKAPTCSKCFAEADPKPKVIYDLEDFPVFEVMES